MNNKATSIVTEDLKSRCKTVVYSFGKYEIKILLDEITNEYDGIDLLVLKTSEELLKEYKNDISKQKSSNSRDDV